MTIIFQLYNWLTLLLYDHDGVFCRNEVAGITEELSNKVEILLHFGVFHSSRIEHRLLMIPKLISKLFHWVVGVKKKRENIKLSDIRVGVLSVQGNSTYPG